MTRFILDSGNPEEYKSVSKLLQDHNQELWGSTTNPSLIAKKLAESGKKLSTKEAFDLQKKIVAEILSIVPGAVSAEVYADKDSTASEMVTQGHEIARWSDRVVVKLPTTIEGFKARTELRKANIMTNNTLVFSQEQIYAICLHEHFLQKEYGAESKWPCFISPFVGRLDDIGEDGMALVTHGMELKKQFHEQLWMLAASIRSVTHLEKSITAQSELVTVPAAIYSQWLRSPATPPTETAPLSKPPLYTPSPPIQNCGSLSEFMTLIESKQLNITHQLTDKGIQKFAQDWKAVLSV